MDIVILHGWGLSGATFSSLADKLSHKGYRVFTPDLPGFGFAKAPLQPFGLIDYAKFVKQYLDLNHLKKIILIGHSFGGRISIKFTEMYPSYVERLILTAVPGFLPVSKEKINFFLILAKMGGFFFSFSLLAPFADFMRKILYRFARASDYLSSKGIMRQTFLKIIRTDLVESMKRISVPTFLVWGSNDIITPLWIGYKMKETIPGAKIEVIKNTGHRVSFSNPGLFIESAKL